MADEQPSKELDSLAFEIYSKRVATQQGNRGGEQVALDSYRQAEAFLAVRKKMRGGEMKAKAPDGPELADCCAPNRPRTDPYNMVSSRFGSLEAVNRVKKWLDANPTPESDQMDIVHRFKSQFHDLQWGRTDEEVFAAITVARMIFPNYVSK